MNSFGMTISSSRKKQNKVTLHYAGQLGTTDAPSCICKYATLYQALPGDKIFDASLLAQIPHPEQKIRALMLSLSQYALAQ